MRKETRGSERVGRGYPLVEDDLLVAFRRGEGPPVHARAGRRALELAYVAIESFETGERVATP